jgi:hypothetical protein
MQFWRLVATTAALVLAGAPTARADIRYVAAGGGDTDCTQPDPCALSIAPSKVADGDQVRLLSSTFNGLGDIAFGKRVTISGQMGARPRLNVGSLQLLAPGSRLEDVTVVGHSQVALIAIDSTVERVEATHEEGTQTVCEFDGDTVVSDTACWANPTASSAGAIGVGGWTDLDTADEYDVLPRPSHITLRNVTAQSQDALIAYTFDTTAATISGSIIAGNIPPTTATLAADHSATSLAGTGNIAVSSDSIFPNLLIGGIHPAAGSPTIDAGTAGGAFDLDGKPRTLGSAPDMGAYEWVPSKPQVTTGDVTSVSSSAALVPGSVDARGAETTFSVEYGVGGYSASLAGGSVGSRTLPVGVAATLNGLAPATTYHYRVVATNSEGTTAGEDRTFTTAALPAATPTPTPTPQAKVTVSLASNKKCMKTRSTSLRVKIATGGTISAVEVYVNKKRVKRVTKAADLKKAIKVTKLPKGAYTLEVRVKTKDGRTVKSSKKYRTCSSSR